MVETPTQAWNDHEYRKVWKVLRAAYAASEDAGKRLAHDSHHAAVLERQIAEPQQRYES
jgi:hypothetical protein